MIKCEECGEDLKMKLLTNCKDCGNEWIKEDYEIVLVGNDVVALFPSLTSQRSGKLVRQEFQISNIKISDEAFNTKLGLRYIVMNKHLTDDLDPIENILPTRRKAPGRKPGMKSREINNSEDDELGDDKWAHPPREPTNLQRRQVQARVAEIVTRIIFENFTYKFAGKLINKSQGDPLVHALQCVLPYW